MLAEVTPGTRHSELATRQAAAQRLDVALPLAQLYIKQARNTGDLRFLGYAEAVLDPWVGPETKSADALVLHATVLQSRHDFSGALAVLETGSGASTERCAGVADQCHGVAGVGRV